MRIGLGQASLVAAVLLCLPLTVAAAPPSISNESYIVGPEDIVEIQVWDNKDLHHVGFVRPDGKTSLPLLGEIDAAGKTVKALQDELMAQYAKKVKDPLVTVIIREIKSRPVYFVGGFGKPGPLQLTRDLNLLQALSVIGGVAAGADAEKGYLLRGDKRIGIDFRQMIEKGDLSQNTQLEPGDTFVVPVAESVYMQGEVKSPGLVKYTTDLTLVKAITQVGGVTPMASPGRVDILRKEGEKRVRMRVDLDNMLRAPEANPDLKLRPEDIIFVPQRLF